MSLGPLQKTLNTCGILLINKNTQPLCNITEKLSSEGLCSWWPGPRLRNPVLHNHYSTRGHKVTPARQSFDSEQQVKKENAPCADKVRFFVVANTGGIGGEFQETNRIRARILNLRKFAPDVRNGSNADDSNVKKRNDSGFRLKLLSPKVHC